MIQEKINSNDIDVTEYYFASNGQLLEQLGAGIFQAQSNNTNVIKIHLEDGSVGEEVNVINFTPLNIRRNYTTHNFYLHPFGITERVITGEKEQRTFSSYYIIVPKLVLKNDSGKQVINEVNVIRKYGVKNLGIFNSVSQLEGEYPANKELKNELATAYVLDGNKSAFYQVELDLHSNTYKWTEKGNEVSFSGKQKQYGVAKAIVNPGFENTVGIPNIDVSTYQMIMQILNDMQHKIDNLDGVIGGVEIIDTNSIDNSAKLIGNKVYLETKLKVDENLNDILKVGNEGVYVKHDVTKLDRKDFENFQTTNKAELDNLKSKDILLDKEIDRIDNKFVEVDESIQENKDNMDSFQSDVNRLDSRLKDNEYLSNDNRRRIINNEKNITDLNQKKMDKSWKGMSFAGDLVNTDELLINRSGEALKITAERLTDFLVSEEFELIKVVSKLPEQDISSNTIYFVPSEKQGENNVYIEYVYANGNWEKLGEFKADFDLSDYFKKDETYSRNEVNELLDLKANLEDLPTKMSELENDIDLVNSGFVEGKLNETVESLNMGQYATNKSLKDVETDLKNSLNVVDTNKLDKETFDEHLNVSNAKFSELEKDLNNKASLEQLDTKAGTDFVEAELRKKADITYVDEKFNNIPEVDLSNIYTKDETYSSTVIDSKLEGKENKIEQFVKDVKFDTANNKFTFDFKTGVPLVVQLPEASLVKSIDLIDNELVFTFEDGSVQKIPLGDLLVGMASEEWVDYRLNLYAKTTYVDSEVSKNKVLIDNLTSTKADKSTMTTELNKKANQTYVDNELSKKSDISYVDEQISKIPKPDLSVFYKKSETYSADEVDNKLNVKADIAYVDNKIDSIPEVDLSNYYTKDETYTKKEVDDELYWKQNRLMSGKNIKTINGYSLIGSGNIDIDAMIAETFPIQIISEEIHFSTNSPAAWLDFLVKNGVEIGEDLTSVPPITVYDALEDMLYVLELAKFEAGVYYTDPLTQRKVYAKVLNMFEAITQGKLFIWKRIPTEDDIGDISKILDDINGV